MPKTYWFLICRRKFFNYTRIIIQNVNGKNCKTIHISVLIEKFIMVKRLLAINKKVFLSKIMFSVPIYRSLLSFIAAG